MPSRATFYRLLEAVSTGQHLFGSARTRRSLGKQPKRMFGQLTAARPGEVMEIDSTPLDVMVIHDDGTVDRCELTGLIDLATRTPAAVVLRPSTKAVDAALLLARAMTPEPVRPGWSDRWQRDGTWARIVTQLQAQADAKGLITWDVNIDSTVCRAHQHAAGASKKGICKRNRPAALPLSRPTMLSDVPEAA